MERRLARLAGLSYLLVALFGGFAHVVRTQVYVPNDARVTLGQVVDNALLVRLSFTADLVQAVFMVLTMLALHRLMGASDRAAARTMFAFVVIFIAITCLNMVSQFGALIVATEPAYATLGPAGPAAMVLLLLNLQHAGYLIAQIFFGLWLWPLGTLILRSGLMPRVLAYLARAATIAYLVDVAAQFLAPSAVASFSAIAIVPVVVLGEVSILGYLLVRGVRGVRTPNPNPYSDSEGPELVGTS